MSYRFSRNLNFALFILDVVLIKWTNEPIWEVVAYCHIVLFALAAFGVENEKN